jgi:hypothetical protein
MAPTMQKNGAAEAAWARAAIAHGELAEAFVQELIHALDSVDAPDPRRVRAEFAASLALLLSKVANIESR